MCPLPGIWQQATVRAAPGNFGTWAAYADEPENGIIHIQERHLHTHWQYIRLPGPMTNRDAYRKPVDWQLKRMLDYLSYDGVWPTLATSTEGWLS